MINGSRKGFTLIEVLVGTFLILVVFLGIVGAYRLGVKLVALSKNKIIANAISTGEIEKIRNLSYGSIGVKNSFPAGILDAVSTTTQNNTEFTIERRVDYAVDPADGIAYPDDDCPNDYKKVEIKVKWFGVFSGEVDLFTDIAPKNLSEECGETGGILSVSVFDALGVMLFSPSVEIFNPTTGELIKSATPATGEQFFSLATSTYKVVVSKTGYSSERTYVSEDVYNGKTIITPEKPNPIVLEGQLTQTSFQIDKASSFSVDTLSTWGTDNFSDSFSDESKISATSSAVIIGGEVNLASTTETGYASSGYVVSKTITPLNLDKWQEFFWSDFEEPATTTIKYQILYFNGSNWTPIPDVDLSGNEAGFDNSPVSLINLATTTYPELRLRANLSTFDVSTTPAVYSWQVTWLTANATSIGNTTFNLQGAKIVGLDASDQPIYKYSVNHTTDSGGHKNISNLEWDSYVFSVNPATGLDLIGIDPSPQPISLSPDNSVAVKLYLDSQNSLLVTVQNSETLAPIFSASARLYKTGYDKTQYTDEKGQTYFIPLTAATYTLKVQAPGYSSYLGNVSISGDNAKIISLEQIE